MSNYDWRIYLITGVVIIVIVFILLDFIFSKGIKARRLVGHLLKIFISVNFDEIDKVKMQHVTYETIVTEFCENIISNLSIRYYSEFVEAIAKHSNEQGEKLFATILLQSWYFIARSPSMIHKNADLLISILNELTDLY